MTIDEAIKHAKEKAKELSDKAYAEWGESMTEEEAYKCNDCAWEHEQIARWLEELKKLRDTMEMIKSRYILVEKSQRDNRNDLMIGRAPTVEPQNNWGRWGISEVRCPDCLEYFNTDCYSKGELNKCPSCGAKMRGGAE